MQLERITLATNDVNSLVAFYNSAFACGLEQLDGSPLLKGELAGTTFVICPNSVAGAVAEQNRYHWRFRVHDFVEVVNRVIAWGGSVASELVIDNHAVVGVVDPEVNTYELTSSERPRYKGEAWVSTVASTVGGERTQW